MGRVATSAAASGVVFGECRRLSARTRGLGDHDDGLSSGSFQAPMPAVMTAGKNAFCA
jgi:hypothetical protein